MSTTTALLVIDVQVGLIDGENPVYQADAMLERIAGLIAAVLFLVNPMVAHATARAARARRFGQIEATEAEKRR